MNLRVKGDRSTLPESELGALNLRRRADIDGLRGLAVLAVLGFHFAPDAVSGGYVGLTYSSSFPVTSSTTYC